MASLRETIVSLVRRRGPFSVAAAQGPSAPKRPASAEPLPEVTNFGTNPGNLRMFVFVPDGLAKSSPLVVVLHGCTQNADGYAHAAGWVRLAEQAGFAVLAPEQQQSNNVNRCLNWFEPADTTRDEGEAFSIWEMVERVVLDHQLDRKRIFVTGLSAGGAMACVMLATYPDVFAAGAIVAGLSYRCAGNVQQALGQMANPQPPAVRSRGDLVRAASLHHGPWPQVSIWHGQDDTVVVPANAQAIARQWCDVHGLGEEAFVQDALDGQMHRKWLDARGAVAVETILVDGLAHGTPIDARGATGPALGTPAPFVVDVGISSTRRIAARWGIEARAESSAAAASTARIEPSRHDTSPSSATPEPRSPLRKILAHGLRIVSPSAAHADSSGEWSTEPSGQPDTAPTYHGYASSGIGCVGGLHTKAMTRTLRPRSGQRLVYERRLHLHAGVNILTSAAFRLSIDGDTLDQETVVFANRMDHDWTVREIDLTRYAGREVEMCFEVSADCNVCMEAFGKAWIRNLRIDESDAIQRPELSRAVPAS